MDRKKFIVLRRGLVLVLLSSMWLFCFYHTYYEFSFVFIIVLSFFFIHVILNRYGNQNSNYHYAMIIISFIKIIKNVLSLIYLIVFDDVLIGLINFFVVLFSICGFLHMIVASCAHLMEMYDLKMKIFTDYLAGSAIEVNDKALKDAIEKNN